MAYAQAVRRFFCWFEEKGIELDRIQRSTSLPTSKSENGGVIEKAQQIGAHESPRTTELYDRTQAELTLDEIERIAI